MKREVRGLEHTVDHVIRSFDENASVYRARWVAVVQRIGTRQSMVSIVVAGSDNASEFRGRDYDDRNQDD